ncbi:hypothetical protein ACUNWD_01360 [Sunxiuqinia sp. A32]|uniref:hypothetical protein n=1 Tax=Sunxiuqinia sp. A32 TaxID=3461496 RepID=UPI004045B9AF
MSNNFKDWLKRNQGKTLNDFKAQRCVTDEAVSVMQKAGKKKKRKITKSQIIGIVVGTIFAAIGSHYGKLGVEKLMEIQGLKKLNKMEFLQSDTIQWITYHNNEANFEILFPEQPEENIQSVESEIGPMEVKIYTYEPELGKDDNILYGAGFSVYPEDLVDSDIMADEEIAEFMNNSINGAVTNVQGKLLTTNTISYKGYPGREIRIDFKNGVAIIKMRIYLVKNKAYISEVITASSNSLNKAVNTFLDSFKLTEE